MTGNDKTPAPRLRRPGLTLALCFAANLLFTLLIYRLFYCRTINDDLILSLFVNGAYGRTDLHTPYQHFLYAALLRALYAANAGLAWYTLVQYALLIAANSVLCFLLLERQGLRTGLVYALLLLAGYGFTACFQLTYTVTAGVCACAGMLLLLRAAERLVRGGGFLPSALGGLALSLMGVLLRWNMALPCMGLLGALALPTLVGLRLHDWPRYAVPFLALLALTAGLFAANRALWRDEPYAAWERLNAARTVLMDYHPSGVYQLYSPGYEAAGVRRSEVEMLSLYCTSDPEVFTPALYETMNGVMAQVEGKEPLPRCLLLFARTMLEGVARQPFYAAAALMLLLWLMRGARLPGVAGLLLLLFSVFYLTLVRQGRYGVARVDHGLLLTGFLTAAMLPGKTGGRRERLCLAAALLGLGLTALLCHPRASLRGSASPEVAASGRQVAETFAALSADGEHVFLDAQALCYQLANDPLLPVAPGIMRRVIPVSGWSMQHPMLCAALLEHGIMNPFRDSVGREDVCWISDEMDAILAYIRDHYAPQAYAAFDEAMSTETGLKIYRIKEG